MSAITAMESNVSDETTGEITRKETVIDPDDLVDSNDYEFMTVEWKIPHYFRFLKKFDHWVKSPMFSFLDEEWRLELCPNGKKFHKRWIHIELHKVYSTTKSRYVLLKARVIAPYGGKLSGLICGSTFEENDSMNGGPIISRYSWREESEFASEDTMTILCELRSKICETEEVVSQTMYTEGGDKCNEGNGKESENTDGVAEAATLPKTTGGDKCNEGNGKESKNTDGVAEAATLPKTTGGNKCYEGNGKESENTDGVAEAATLPKTTGGDKCNEGNGKESKNTDGVAEAATLPKTTGGDKCNEGNGMESKNTDGVAEAATLPKTTGGDKCIQGLGKESKNTDGKAEDATLPKPTGIDKLARDLQNLLTSEKDCDITLRLKNKEFRAHKNILRSRSSVFDSMFDQDMAEKNSGIVDIPNCDPEAFQNFLTYLYSASVDNLSNDIAFNLYFIADKYDTEELKHKCVDFMASNLAVDTFCNVVALALQHEESALLETATDFFMKNTMEVMESVRWQSFFIENPVTANELYKKSFQYNVNQK